MHTHASRSALPGARLQLRRWVYEVLRVHELLVEVGLGVAVRSLGFEKLGPSEQVPEA